MPIFKFVQGLFYKEFVVTARRYTLPHQKQPVFSSFTIRAANRYEAARQFDTTYSSWTRLDVSEPRQL